MKSFNRLKAPPAPHLGEHRDRGGALTAVLLVRLVLAVGAAVAAPARVDALATAAVELEGQAGLVQLLGRRVAAPAVLRPLVRAIVAVGVAVAGPQRRDAGRAVALEAGGAAGGRGAGLLVRAVQAVSVGVADEVGGDALAVVAAELVLGTGLGGCGDGRKKSRSPGAQHKPNAQMGTLREARPQLCGPCRGGG